MITKKPDNSLTYGNVPDDFLCPKDCPRIEECLESGEACIDCDYFDYQYDEKMSRADEKYDAWVDAHLDDSDDKDT